MRGVAYDRFGDESVLQIRVPELIDSTRLSQDLPRQGTFQERYEPHSSPPQPKGYLCELQ